MLHNQMSIKIRNAFLLLYWGHITWSCRAVVWRIGRSWGDSGVFWARSWCGRSCRVLYDMFTLIVHEWMQKTKYTGCEIHRLRNTISCTMQLWQARTASHPPSTLWLRYKLAGRVQVGSG